MNPYATSLTMPDGTTRAPLIERVEACRPRAAEMVLLNDSIGCYWSFDDDVGRREYVGDVPGRALCRMVAMDWLGEFAEQLRITYNDDIRCAILLTDDYFEGNGATLDEALAIACHLRLDAEQAPAQEVK